MSAEHLWVAPGEVVTDVSDHVLLPSTGGDGFRVQSNADEGSVGSSEMVFDDPDGTFAVQGLNAYRIRESTSEAADPYLYVGHFGSRTESRGDVYKTGGGRRVTAQLQDINALLSRYVILPDEDGDRPSETDTDRMTWLLGTSAMDFLTLYGSLDTSLIDTAGVTLSESDLTDYTPQQILDDMAQQSGRNYFVWWNGEDEAYQLVYADDAGTHLSSDLRFSNVIDDVDESTTFFAGLDWELEIDPSRVASTVVVRYAKGRERATDDDTAALFGRVDKVMDASLVKSASVAADRVGRYLDDLDTEEHTLTGTVYLPASKASQFRAGMRVQMRAVHLTGLSEFTWVRLTEVTVVQISEDPTLTYALAFSGMFAVAETVMQWTLEVGSAIYIGEGSDRTRQYGSDVGGPLPTLTAGKEYRIVVQVLVNLNTPINGDDSMHSYGVTLHPSAGSASFVVQPTYSWDPSSGSTTADLEYVATGGPAWSVRAGAADGYYAAGQTITGEWCEFIGPTIVGADVALNGQVLSGFYGFHNQAIVRLEERTP